MNNKIFISGRISGDENYRRKFVAAVRKVEDFCFFDRHGVEVYQRTGEIEYRAVNPVWLRLAGLPVGFYSWRMCMVVCLWHLLWCSTVYMLRDWHESRGARIENKVAMWLGKRIIYEEDEMK